MTSNAIVPFAPAPSAASARGLASVLLRGGTVVDQHGTRRADVLVRDGRIIAVAADVDDPRATVIECDGSIIAPGLVDLHTHLREPGKEEAETIETGSRAAAMGGYTSVVAMPNTTPPIDSVDVVRSVIDLARFALCRVVISGAITVGRKGEQLAPMGEMAALGVRMFTDDGTGVQDNRLMRRAMEYAGPLGVILSQHCEDAALAGDGAMHEGAWSSKLGIPGQPAEAEELMVMRDLALARLTGTPVHFQHLSTAGSVAMVRAAKAGGMRITCEATPHHFTLTHAACASYDAVFKVNPPLRTEEDVAAIIDGLVDGTIDCIATDHAPHTPDSKELPFDQAPPGMLGLETALALAITQLGSRVDMAHLLGLVSWRPAAIMGLPAAGVVEGAPADLVVFDPTERWTVDRTALHSRAVNTPFHGMEVTGRVRHTICAGELVVTDAVPQR